jgi:hypothetical protein
VAPAERDRLLTDETEPGALGLLAVGQIERHCAPNRLAATPSPV